MFFYFEPLRATKISFGYRKYGFYFASYSGKRTSQWLSLHLRACFISSLGINCKDVCLQNTSKSHSYHLKIWRLL